MPFSPGERLGHYEIVALIGSGGMGEVYEARDTRLNRAVAIKVLLEHLSNQADARARFLREAQTIAGLKHPHISTLHDIGRHQETDFLVMELLEGQTLSDRLARGPLPLRQALDCAIEIADALDQAHRHGVTHRDLKPANVMLTKSGVKVLDFGLAKLREGKEPMSAAPTATHLTAEGAVLGTVQYMAPEQLEGGEADPRTDIFAFGTVLHEMVTGRPAFTGKSKMSLVGSILRDMPPPVSTLQPVAPLALSRLITTCLAKDPDDRWQSARDVWRELKWIVDSGESGDEPAPAGTVYGASRRVGPVRAAVAAAIVAAAAAAAIVWTLKPAAPGVEATLARVAIALPLGDQIGDRVLPSVVVSADGSTLAYVGRRAGAVQLFVRPIGTLETRAVPGTEGAASPFFSPDGQWIGFVAQGKLKKVPAVGGAVETLCDAAIGMGATWAPGDTIYFSPFSTAGLWKVSALGGTPEPVTVVDRSKGEFSHRWPQILPGGKALLLTVWNGPGWDERHLQVLRLDTGERRSLVQGASAGRYVASGHLLYARADALMAVPFDLARLQTTGPPIALPERALDDDGGHFSVSDTGTLAYLAVSPRRFERQLVWADSKGNVEALPAPQRGYTDPAISPDGRFVAFSLLGPTNSIWVYDVTRQTLAPLTAVTTGSSSQSPVWTPDGKRVAYRATRGGYRNLFWKAADGSDDEERLTTSEDVQTPRSWTPDAQYLAFASGSDLWVWSAADRQPHAYLKTPSPETSPAFSPDGRWLAYSSSESGAAEVYVRPFPGPGSRLQISTSGGTEPVWARDGSQLFYREGNRWLSVAMSATAPLTVGSPRVLFEGPYLPSDTSGAGYDVAADGRFLMVRPVEPEQPSTQIELVLNWFKELGAPTRGR